MLRDYKLPGWDNFILTIHGLAGHLGIPDDKALQLDSTNTVIEQVPITINHELDKRISRLL
jgi:hypothetical protein